MFASRAVLRSWFIIMSACCCASSPLEAADFFGGLIRFQTEPAAPPDSENTSGFGFAGSLPGPPDRAPDSGLMGDYHGPEILLHQNDPNDAFRHIGKGEPLTGTSWLNRPVHIGWFFGGLVGDELIDGRVDQEDDIFGGYRVGWDWDHYWGSELRLGFARPDVADSISDESPRISRDWFLDAHLDYYPWGDARWRPYFSAGMGIATFEFLDETFASHDETLFQMPLGVGVKYLVDGWFVARADLLDNIAFGGSGLDTMHNITYTFGIEAHFGPGTSRKYAPW